MSRNERYEVFINRPDEEVNCPACHGSGDFLVDDGRCPLCDGTGELTGRSLMELAVELRQGEMGEGAG